MIRPLEESQTRTGQTNSLLCQPIRKKWKHADLFLNFKLSSCSCCLKFCFPLTQILVDIVVSEYSQKQLRNNSATVFKAKYEKPHFSLSELGSVVDATPLSLHVSAILCGSALGQQKYPRWCVPLSCFARWLDFWHREREGDREGEDGVHCCLLAGMIVHLHVADGGICCARLCVSVWTVTKYLVQRYGSQYSLLTAQLPWSETKMKSAMSVGCCVGGGKEKFFSNSSQWLLAQIYLLNLFN